MSGRESRWEVVHTDAGWLCRFIAANGREVLRSSETYTRRAAAERAMWLARDAAIRHYERRNLTLEIRDVDERAS